MLQRNAGGLTQRACYWQGLIDDWRRSGRTQKAFCRERHVNHGTFGWWKRQLARRTSSTVSGLPAGQGPGLLQTAFAPVRIQADDIHDAPALLEIVLAGQRCIRLRGPVDRQQLTDVLAVLEAPPC